MRISRSSTPTRNRRGGGPPPSSKTFSEGIHQMRTILIYNISLKAFPARPHHQPAGRQPPPASAGGGQRGRQPPPPWRSGGQQGGGQRGGSRHRPGGAAATAMRGRERCDQSRQKCKQVGRKGISGTDPRKNPHERPAHGDGLAAGGPRRGGVMRGDDKLFVMRAGISIFFCCRGGSKRV